MVSCFLGFLIRGKKITDFSFPFASEENLLKKNNQINQDNYSDYSENHDGRELRIIFIHQSEYDYQ